MLKAKTVRSWYGLKGEIDVEYHLYHLVKVGPIPLPHPPLVNLLLRRGLRQKDRLELSYLHEFGHLQTLPIALIHLLSLFWIQGRSNGKVEVSLKFLLRMALAHEAAWELASEVYVLFKSGRRYMSIYKKYPNKLGHVLFWGGMISIVSFLSLMSFRGETYNRNE